MKCGPSACGPSVSKQSCCTSRNFLSRDEKVEMLQEYKESLDKESKAVNERIAELKKAA